MIFNLFFYGKPIECDFLDKKYDDTLFEKFRGVDISFLEDDKLNVKDYFLEEHYKNLFEIREKIFVLFEGKKR